MDCDGRAERGCGWDIEESVGVVLSSSVRFVIRRYVVVRLRLDQSFGGVTTVQPLALGALALVARQSSEKEDDENKCKDSDSG